MVSQVRHMIRQFLDRHLLIVSGRHLLSTLQKYWTYHNRVRPCHTIGSSRLPHIPHVYEDPMLHQTPNQRDHSIP